MFDKFFTRVAPPLTLFVLLFALAMLFLNANQRLTEPVSEPMTWEVPEGEGARPTEAAANLPSVVVR